MTPERPFANGAARSVDGEQHKTCTVCGQTYDAYDFTQHSHHSTALHAPLIESEASS